LNTAGLPDELGVEPLPGKESTYGLQHGLLFLLVVALDLLVCRERRRAWVHERHHGQHGIAMSISEPLVVGGDVGEHALGVLASIDR
jgi:hypothetical protein